MFVHRSRRWLNIQTTLGRRLVFTVHRTPPPPSKQLQLVTFYVTAVCLELRDSLLPSSTGITTAVQRQTAVTAYLLNKQFVFELQNSLLPSSTGITTAVQRQTAVTAD